MSLSSEKSGDVLIVSAVGQINSANALAIETQLLGFVDRGERECVLDLTRLDYISSAGLRVVLMLAKRLKQHAGRMVLCGLQPQIREDFEVSGFLALLTVADKRPEALQALARLRPAPPGAETPHSPA